MTPIDAIDAVSPGTQMSPEAVGSMTIFKLIGEYDAINVSYSDILPELNEMAGFDMSQALSERNYSPDTFPVMGYVLAGVAKTQNLALDTMMDSAQQLGIMSDAERQAIARYDDNKYFQELEAWSIVASHLVEHNRDRIFTTNFPDHDLKLVKNLWQEINIAENLVSGLVNKFNDISNYRCETDFDPVTGMLFSNFNSKMFPTFFVPVRLEGGHVGIGGNEIRIDYPERPGWELSGQDQTIRRKMSTVHGAVIDAIRQEGLDGADYREIQRRINKATAENLIKLNTSNQGIFSREDQNCLQAIIESNTPGSDADLFREYWKLRQDDEKLHLIRKYQQQGASLAEILLRIAHGAKIVYDSFETSTPLGSIATDVASVGLHNAGLLITDYQERTVNIDGTVDVDGMLLQLGDMIGVAQQVASADAAEALSVYADGSPIGNLLAGKYTAGYENLQKLIRDPALKPLVNRLAQARLVQPSGNGDGLMIV